MHAIVSSFYDSVGGISTYVKNVLKYSSISGVNYLLITPDLKYNSSENGIFAVDSPFKLVVILKAIYLLCKKKVRYIQCHGTWYLALSCCIYRFIMKIAGTTVKVSVVKHSDINIVPNSIKKYILEFIDNNSDAVIFVSRYLKNKYMEDFEFVFRKPVFIVNPGCSIVNLDLKKIDGLKSKLDIANKTPLLTYIGLFEYQGKVNGLLLLLEAVQKLKTYYPDIHLAIAGRGSYRDKVIQTINRLELSENATILKDIDNPYNLLSISKLHCHITYQDNFPIVVLEALNVNVPVVASETGELKNIEINGLTLTKLDIDSITSSIVASLRNPPVVDIPKLRKKYNWYNNARLLNRITENLE